MGQEYEKTNKAVGMKNCITMDRGKKRLVRPFIRHEFWKFIGCIILIVNYDNKGHKHFGFKYQKSLVRTHQINYKEMFMGTQNKIKHVVIYIVIFTFMLVI